MGLLKKTDFLQLKIDEQSTEIYKLHRALDDANENYVALERGRDEMEEGYQQMILEFRDALEKISTYNLELQKEVAIHQAVCLLGLPDLSNNYTPLDEDVSTTER